MPSLPLCHWSSQLFDEREPSSAEVPVSTLALFFGTALGYKHRFFLQILLKKKITSIDQYVLRLPSFPSAIFRLRTSREHHFCEKTARPPYLETTLIDALSLVLSSMLFARTASNFNMSYCPSSMVDKNVKYIVKSSVLLKRLQFSKVW